MRQGFRRFRVAATSLTICLAAATAAALLGGCGSSGGTASSSTTAKLDGVRAVPSKPAPALALSDSLGHPVNIDQYRGKAVLITFIYTHCPDTCPLIVGNLHTAQSQLGPEARKLQILAVSVDPRGDTPSAVNAFLRAHRMTGRMEYLIGSRPQLIPTWRAWNVLAKGPQSNSSPDQVAHSALIYGISASGKITTLYPSNFKPSQVVHDVPILASG